MSILKAFGTKNFSSNKILKGNQSVPVFQDGYQLISEHHVFSIHLY